LRNYNTVIDSRISEPGVEHKKVFLLQLINNKLLSLYTYTDNNKQHFYISTSNGNPVELINQYLYVEKGNMLRKNEAFKEQLTTVLADCPEIAQKTRDLPYLENPIKKLVVQYLECALPGTAIESRKDKVVQVDFGIIAGVMYNSYTFSGNGYLTKGEFSSNISPVIGASVDVGFKVNNNKWYIVNELVYKQYKTSANLFTHTVLYDYNEYIDFSFPYLQLNTMLRYSFSVGGSVKPFLNAGMGNAYKVAAGKNTSRTVYSDGRDDKVKQGLEDASRYERSMIFGAGVVFSRIQIEARYSLGNGFSPYVNTKSKVNSPQLIVAYKF